LKNLKETHIKYNNTDKSFSISHTYHSDVKLRFPKGIHNIEYEIKGGCGAYSNIQSHGQLFNGKSSVLEGSILTLKVGFGGLAGSEKYHHGRTTLINGYNSDGVNLELVAGGGKGEQYANNNGDDGYIKLTIHVLIKNLI
jgi:hypothetical protein